jgi:hypothetical protein
MSSDVCTTCKHRPSCTYPHNQVIVQCEEHEYAESRAARQVSRKPESALAAAKSSEASVAARSGS